MTTDKKDLPFECSARHTVWPKDKGFYCTGLKNFTKNIITKPGRSKLFGSLMHFRNAAKLSLLEHIVDVNMQSKYW